MHGGLCLFGHSSLLAKWIISKLDLADMNYGALEKGLYEEVTNDV
jgi:hypothetical protein